MRLAGQNTAELGLESRFLNAAMYTNAQADVAHTQHRRPKAEDPASSQAHVADKRP